MSDVSDTAIQRPMIVRCLMAAGGVLSVGMAALGAVTPGLPTTVFLIIASYLFVRSFPSLERKFIRNKFFGPFLKYVDNPGSMPLGAKIFSLVLMWGSVIGSTFTLYYAQIPLWVLPLPIIAAGFGTYFIVRPVRQPATVNA